VTEPVSASASSTTSGSYSVHAVPTPTDIAAVCRRAAPQLRRHSGVPPGADRLGAKAKLPVHWSCWGPKAKLPVHWSSGAKDAANSNHQRRRHAASAGTALAPRPATRSSARGAPPRAGRRAGRWLDWQQRDARRCTKAGGAPRGPG